MTEVPNGAVTYLPYGLSVGDRCSVSLDTEAPVDSPVYGLILVYVDATAGWDGEAGVYLSPENALAIGRWLVATAESVLSGSPLNKIGAPRIDRRLPRKEPHDP